jgi:NAD(P)-dependent dehydrogenase (short-subunit alcohol dehydrogenase family)
MSLNPPIRDWQGKRVWLVGASSGIGLALAQHLHRLGARVLVSARRADALQEFVAAHPGSLALPLDVTDRAGVARVAAQALADGPLDLVCYCAGHYTAMRATAIDLDDLLRHHDINTVGLLYLLHVITPALLAQGHGHISLVSSVAGYRGLPQAMAYGPTKAALINLAETLYLDLHPKGLGISLVNPGFVETPLTAGNQFHMPALITADEAAREMVKGWTKGQFEIHFPRRFTRVMKLLALLPYRLYFAAVRRSTGL